MQNVKKSADKYEDFAHSKQTFPNVRFLEAFNGDVILRGRDGQRDRAYPLHKAAQRFWRMYDMMNYWAKQGFQSQTQEGIQVLENLGAKIQQAIVQRATGHATEGIPKWADAKFMERLAKAVLSCKKPHF